MKKNHEVNVGLLLHTVAGVAEGLVIVAIGISLNNSIHNHLPYATEYSQALRLAFEDTFSTMTIPLLCTFIGGPIMHIAAINARK